MMAAVRLRPYRRILTSALHRRFVHASALALLVCYLVAFAIGDKSSFFWSWFPIGGCGIRTILLFVSYLVVFVLRVGQMHIGSRTTTSSIVTAKHLLPLHFIQTFGWYLFSAWWFSEIYKWSRPLAAELEWVKRGRPYERASLNERPLYIYSYHILLAVVQSVVHLYSDYDCIPIGVAKRTPGAADQRTHQVESVSKRIQLALPNFVRDGIVRSAGVTLVCPVIYTFFLRRPAWSFTMYFAKLFWNFPRSAADPPGLVPPITPGLSLRCLFSGSMLVICWQTANLFFSVFISKEPLKRAQPLTVESNDPNGSLLDGLKAKKETVRAFAFWELCLISQQFTDRRKAIFNDIDREGGSAWSQIMQSATAEIKGISTRIDETIKPSPGPSTSETEQAQPVIHSLPRLTDSPKEGNVFASSPKANSRHEKFGDAFSTAAKSYGQSPDWTPVARAKARDAFDRASTAVLSPERKQKLLASTREIKLLTDGTSTRKPENVHPLIAQFLRSPLGQPFRQTYDRRLSSIVLGTPYAIASPIVDAVESLNHLLVASLQEDSYGTVQSDVPNIVRLFTDTTKTLDALVNGGLDAHWTDVSFPSSSDPAAQMAARHVPNVELVLDALKMSLADLLTVFKPYLRDIGLVGKDLRLAKEAAGLVEGDAEMS